MVGRNEYLNYANYIGDEDTTNRDVQFGRDYWDANKDCPNDLLKSMIPYF